LSLRPRLGSGSGLASRVFFASILPGPAIVRPNFVPVVVEDKSFNVSVGVNPQSLQNNHMGRMILNNCHLDPLRGTSFLQKQQSQARIALLDAQIGSRTREYDRGVNGILPGYCCGGSQVEDKGTDQDSHFRQVILRLSRRSQIRDYDSWKLAKEEG
jgi:hypothetical protein